MAILTGCGTGRPGPAGQNPSAATTAPDPDRPFPQPRGLPREPVAATDALRLQMVSAWRPLLRDSGLRYQRAGFSTTMWRDDRYEARLTVMLDDADPDGVDIRIARAAASNGWGQAGVSHGLNLRKGPFVLSGQCIPDRCSYEIWLDDLEQEIDLSPQQQRYRVPELEGFLLAQPTGAGAPSSSTSTAAPRN
ncbi:hypothetical protein PZ938_03510 [Luteipulveratus sp. YIM 133132]|uniref:Lipoprotein n=1 Tax=Luteipulveratus flavus TaxID=3031728 RepID=A0ABT6C2G1_9MICO|nr:MULTISPECIES: hypothetical protein [unclassified Luteipulveratus]MDE9364661.1 hypothetical protein [Luteipulveratus sp. YIM 133132]MDF8262821.1 hypothetical protein [Luteipulveratus sp. YIM 133296]